ncbi:hypothetical protein FGB62_86g012 [Gracilaria domingensis]|nr:hypothetical protein FGB62_86g012 [Gracilaria domingensis]
MTSFSARVCHQRPQLGTEFKTCSVRLSLAKIESTTPKFLALPFCGESKPRATTSTNASPVKSATPEKPIRALENVHHLPNCTSSHRLLGAPYPGLRTGHWLACVVPPFERPAELAIHPGETETSRHISKRARAGLPVRLQVHQRNSERRAPLSASVRQPGPGGRGLLHGGERRLVRHGWHLREQLLQAALPADGPHVPDNHRPVSCVRRRHAAVRAAVRADRQHQPVPRGRHVLLGGLGQPGHALLVRAAGGAARPAGRVVRADFAVSTGPAVRGADASAAALLRRRQLAAVLHGAGRRCGRLPADDAQLAAAAAVPEPDKHSAAAGDRWCLRARVGTSARCKFMRPDA